MVSCPPFPVGDADSGYCLVSSTRNNSMMVFGLRAHELVAFKQKRTFDASPITGLLTPRNGQKSPFKTPAMERADTRFWHVDRQCNGCMSGCSGEAPQEYTNRMSR